MTEETRISNRQMMRDPANRYLFKQFREKSALIFICYNDVISGRIKAINDYEIKLLKKNMTIHKINILYFFKPDATPAVKSAVGVNRKVSNLKLYKPARGEERTPLPEGLINKCFKGKVPIILTLRNGHVFKGTIHDNGVFSMRLQIAEESRIIIMKHAIYDFTPASQGASSA